MREQKYIDLLLNECLKLKEGMSLFINYDKLNKDFVDKLVSYANELGISDIYLQEIDSYYEHDFLKNSSDSNIKDSKIFNSSIWDEYAKKDAAFLMLECFIPNLMDDIDSKKIALASYIRRTTKPIYKEKQLKGLIPWCIAIVPNEIWAKDLFPESVNPLENFWQILENICMLDKDDPRKAWRDFLKNQKVNAQKLNELKISKLYYKNSLGTNLEIELLKDSLWESSGTDKGIENMPSYEIFTTPNYKKTNGIVYSSKPLIYNGKLIEDFCLKFENGKVIEVNAKNGDDVLKEIVNSDELSSYLGEVALVNYDSPISNSNIVFKTTLIDENASCHLALGSGFIECLKNGNKYNDEELDKLGLNLSKNHVDFMIGTEDLTIEADTINGRVTIMKNGNLVI